MKTKTASWILAAASTLGAAVLPSQAIAQTDRPGTIEGVCELPSGSSVRAQMLVDKNKPFAVDDGSITQGTIRAANRYGSVIFNGMYAKAPYDVTISIDNGEIVGLESRLSKFYTPVLVVLEAVEEVPYDFTPWASKSALFKRDKWSTPFSQGRAPVITTDEDGKIIFKPYTPSARVHNPLTCTDIYLNLGPENGKAFWEWYKSGTKSTADRAPATSGNEEQTTIGDSPYPRPRSRPYIPPEVVEGLMAINQRYREEYAAWLESQRVPKQQLTLKDYESRLCQILDKKNDFLGSCFIAGTVQIEGRTVQIVSTVYHVVQKLKPDFSALPNRDIAQLGNNAEPNFRPFVVLKTKPSHDLAVLAALSTEGELKRVYFERPNLKKLAGVPLAGTGISETKPYRLYYFPSKRSFFIDEFGHCHNYWEGYDTTMSGTGRMGMFHFPFDIFQGKLALCPGTTKGEGIIYNTSIIAYLHTQHQPGHSGSPVANLLNDKESPADSLRYTGPVGLLHAGKFDGALVELPPIVGNQIVEGTRSYIVRGNRVRALTNAVYKGLADKTSKIYAAATRLFR